MIDSDYDDGCGSGGGGKGKLKRLKAICRHRRLHLSLVPSLSSLHYALKYASIYQSAKVRVSAPDELSGRVEGRKDHLQGRGGNDC